MATLIKLKVKDENNKCNKNNKTLSKNNVLFYCIFLGIYDKITIEFKEVIMEKVGEVKKENKFKEVLATKTAKLVIGTVLMSGIGIALPRIFHILAGASAGATYLPMHIAVLISAIAFGVISASIVAGSSIVFSFLLTGMPSVQRLPYMLIELLIYAMLLGLFSKKYNSYISLIATIVLGRVLYAGVLFVSVNILGLQAYGISVWESVKMGIPGLILQLICVPFIASSIKKGLHLDD